jgi:hypothetical protein
MQSGEKCLEIVTAVMLAVASLLTAWSAYQASAWSSEQATMAQVIARKRLEATRALAHAGQLQIVDAIAFGQWLEASRSGDRALAQYHRARFRAAFTPAFEAWLKLDPENNPGAPMPFELPEYSLTQAAKADAAEVEAAAASERFQFANDTSTAYVRNTLFTATTLFLGALAGRFAYRPVRYGMLALAGLMLLIRMVNAAALPKISAAWTSSGFRAILFSDSGDSKSQQPLPCRPSPAASPADAGRLCTGCRDLESPRARTE